VVIFLTSPLLRPAPYFHSHSCEPVLGSVHIESAFSHPIYITPSAVSVRLAFALPIAWGVHHGLAIAKPWEGQRRDEEAQRERRYCVAAVNAALAKALRRRLTSRNLQTRGAPWSVSHPRDTTISPTAGLSATVQ
jgi:hypothetical protein